jgi:hypothetical protein
MPGAECRNCRLGLTRFFSLDSQLLLDRNVDQLPERLEILYCWECALPKKRFSYRIASKNVVEVLNMEVGRKEVDFPYENYPRWFREQPVRIEPLSLDLTSDLEQYCALAVGEPDKVYEYWSFERRDIITTPRHQIGGVPFLYEYSKVQCEECRRDMRFLLVVSDESFESQKFTGNEYVQVVYFYCDRCNIIVAMQESD